MTLIASTKLIGEICIVCGISFAMPSIYQDRLRETHNTFYCPNGHGMSYRASTEEERLRKELLRERECIRQYKEENIRLIAQLDGALDKISKIKKRVKAGVCIYCKRHFANLERHMNCKHKQPVK